jgi:putative intracellular protease/amidase
MKRIAFALALFLLATTVAVKAADAPKPDTRNVAIVIYENAEPLDWTGPFEVYNDASSFARYNEQPAFNVFVVSKTTNPVNSQGLLAVPQYSISNAPHADIVVFPGGEVQNITNDPEFSAWAEKAAKDAEIAQSVCTGAFVLGKAGLLDGLEVTTWYGAIDRLQEMYPKATVRNGRRFVDNGHVVTTAGISAGTDGSLHVVARLLGQRVAERVAQYMEYHWTPDSYLTSRYSYLNPSIDPHGRLLQSAEIDVDAKDYSSAVAKYRAAISERPNERRAWMDLGNVLEKSDDDLGAAAAFTKASTLAPGSPAARSLFRAAHAYAAGGSVEDATHALRRSLEAGFTDRAAILADPLLAKLSTEK